MGRHAGVVVTSLGLVVSGLFLSSGAAESVPVGSTVSPRAAAAKVPCRTGTEVRAVQNGYFKLRYLDDRKLVDQYSSTTQLPGPVDSLISGPRTPIEGGVRIKYTAYSPGRVPVVLEVEAHDDDRKLVVKKVGPIYLNAFPGRLVVDSGSYYAYGVNKAGELVQYSRYRTNDGNLYFSSKRVVAKKQGGIRTLAFAYWAKRKGVLYDYLVATTASGALKHYAIPMKKPSRTKITVLRKSGFADYDQMSSTGCSANKSYYFGMVLVDVHKNLARLFMFRNPTAPAAKTVTNYGLVAPGADWRWHAVG